VKGYGYGYGVWLGDIVRRYGYGLWLWGMVVWLGGMVRSRGAPCCVECLICHNGRNINRTIIVASMRSTSHGSTALLKKGKAR
jgi:hypothetical protein